MEIIKYFTINDEINEELIATLQAFLNGCSNDDEITMYMTSHGGWTTSTDILIRTIKTDDRIKKVVFQWAIESSAFDVLWNTPLEKRVVSDNVWVSLHLASRELSYRKLIEKDKRQEYLIKKINAENDEWLSFFKKIGVKKKHLKIIKNGGLAILTHEETMKLLDKNK